MVGLIPLFAVTTLGRPTKERLPFFAEHSPGFSTTSPSTAT